MHAFAVAYSHDPARRQTSLGTHRDDSDYTINLCLATTADGADLVLEGSGAVYRHAPLRGVIHRGDVVHRVDELRSGERSCVIVWVKLEDPPEGGDAAAAAAGDAGAASATS